MKSSFFFGILFTSTLAFAQVDLQPKVHVVASGPEWQLLNRVVSRLEGQNQFNFPKVPEVLTDENIINAYAIRERRLIVIPIGMVRFLRESEGELAFVVAHEMGHIVDRACYNPPKARLGIDTGVGTQRICEARADEIGIQFLIGAGYNPFDAAAFFGRMMMYQGDVGLQRFLSKWVYPSTHPVNSDRIADMRRTLGRYCQRFPAQCE